MRSIALALLLLAAPAALAATSPEARVQKELGDRLRKEGDGDGAARAYRAALQLDGGYAEAHEALGEVYYSAKQPDKAIEAFGYAVEIDPQYANAWYNLAYAARRSGDHQKARTAYEKYVKLRPTDVDGHYGLAESLRALGNRGAAIVEYQLYIDLARSTPEQAPRVEKARAAIAELKGPPKVEAAPERAPAVATGGAPPAAGAAPPAAAPVVVAPVPVPTSAPPVTAPPPAAPPSAALIEKLGAGDRAWLSGDYRAALFAYQDAVYLDPASAVARIRLARAYTSLNHPDEAERQLRQALELDPGSPEASRLLDELRKPVTAPPRPAGSVAPAAAMAPAAQGPRSYRLTDDVAPTAPAPAPPAAAGPGGSGAGAAGAPGAAPAATPNQEAVRRYRSALAMIGERDFKGAVLELDQALILDPKLGVAFAARASALYGLARYKDAARDYETALPMVPAMATPIFGLAETYRALDDPRAGDLYARYAASDASDVRPELREAARQRAIQYGSR